MMHNSTLFPALRRVYPTMTGTSFVEQGRAKTVKTADIAQVACADVDGDSATFSAGSTQAQLAADAASTLFLASAAGRLGPVLGMLVLLWGLIAWSAGWLGAIAS